VDLLSTEREFKLAPLEEPNIEKDLDVLRGALNSIQKGKASAKEMAYALKLIEEYQKNLENAGTRKWFMEGTPFSIERCPKHKAFFKAGATYPQRIFLASNRTGKTIAGAYELSCHLTGEYPSWWEGRRFDGPIKAWACGQTGQTTRDTVQKELLGPVGAFGTGMIPREKIGRTWARPGVPNGIDTAEVYHVSGGISSVGFKSYDQDIKAFYGTAMDVIWEDEECPELIHNECLLRTMTTNGIIYVTFTPLHGLTPFIVNFSRDADYLEGAMRIVAIEEDKDDQ
jgi:phage terminase large subunit-like protein